MATGRMVLALLALWVVLATLGACEQVIGLEDRVFDGQAVASAECTEYCSTVQEACVGDHAVYTTVETCLGACAEFEPGDPLEPTSNNTLACRSRQAELALSTEPDVHCPRAGPSGGGFCGTECESYCALSEAICPDSATSDCLEKCPALRDNEGFDVTRDHDGDTLECRIVHVSAASVNPDEHCAHAGLVSSDFCVDPPDEAPDCEVYCDFVMDACTGDLAQFDSEDQCESVCEALDLGTNADQSENTVGCRHYHAHNALLDDETHCPHAGPSGAGVCGTSTEEAAGPCVAYCEIVEAACEDDFALLYGSDEDCVSDCTDELSDEPTNHSMHYTVARAEVAESGLACRLLNATRAFEDQTLCAAALGQGSCE